MLTEKQRMQSELAENEVRIKELMKANLDLTAKNIQLENRVAVCADLEKQNKDFKSSCESLLKQKEMLQKEVLTASDCIIESEEKANGANKMAVELLNKLKEADKEVDYLKNLLWSSKQSQKTAHHSTENPFI